MLGKLIMAVGAETASKSLILIFRLRPTKVLGWKTLQPSEQESAILFFSDMTNDNDQWQLYAVNDKF